MRSLVRYKWNISRSGATNLLISAKNACPLLTCTAGKPIPHAKKGPRLNRGPFGFIEQRARDYALSASNCFMKATSASTPSRGMAL